MKQSPGVMKQSQKTAHNRTRMQYRSDIANIDVAWFPCSIVSFSRRVIGPEEL